MKNAASQVAFNSNKANQRKDYESTENGKTFPKLCKFVISSNQIAVQW